MKRSRLPAPLSASVDLFVEPPVNVGDQVEFAARLVEPSATRRLWFRFPARTAAQVTRRADPFVIASLIHVADRAGRLNVHGTISDGLLANLADFLAAYSVFHRGAGRAPLEIHATETGGVPAAARSALGISAFSGGVDSCFSVFRHTALSAMQPKRHLGAALMMHGFDIPLEERGVFARSAERSRALTNDAGLALHTGATNLRTLPIKWEDIYATAVAASLSFFQPAYAFGLLPSFQDWEHTKFNYGSSPLTDPMLSSLAFPIVHDGAAFGRLEKLRQLAQWPGALRNLRVCWQGDRLDRNCCRCEKCVRTMLMLEVVGVQDAPAFPLPLDVPGLDHLVIKGPNALEEQGCLIDEARRLQLKAPWVEPVARSFRRNRRSQRLWRAGRTIKEFIPDSLQDGLRHTARRLVWRHAPAVSSNGASP